MAEANLARVDGTLANSGKLHLTAAEAH